MACGWNKTAYVASAQAVATRASASRGPKFKQLREEDNSSVTEKKRRTRRRRRSRRKQKDVASMACTHEGGAKLLQLLPAAASSLQIWGAQMAGGLPPNHAGVKALQLSPKIDTACSVPQSHKQQSHPPPPNPSNKSSTPTQLVLNR